MLGELADGIARLADGSKKRGLSAWLQNDLRGRFGERVLMVTPEVALKWGQLSGGATGIVHSMIAVTRNVRDLEATGVLGFDPWSDTT